MTFSNICYRSHMSDTESTPSPLRGRRKMMEHLAMLQQSRKRQRHEIVNGFQLISRPSSLKESLDDSRDYLICVKEIMVFM
ncbi:hypothetical protein Baya_2394 [Bagarius yarrelli]|uniref:Uncharacterized protein n=1 Tax=Bagarius yarrelli TaxID=175774 RepID=A0A556TNT7_BAGYA|nr:hypothetical protein Baya_2394 [Bagarius yarrelli]